MKRIGLFNRIGCCLLMSGIIIGSVSCEKETGKPAEKDQGSEITAFKITTGDDDTFNGAINSKDGTIFITLPTDYNKEALKNLKPTIFISPYATITPSTDEAQDFSQEVVYVVKSNTGVEKTWKVNTKEGDPLPEGEGVGYIKRMWTVNPSTETDYVYGESVGICGDFVVIGSNGALYDKETGVKSDKVLNTTGVEGFPTNVIYLINDTKGNMVGLLWDNTKTSFYKWTSATEAPVHLGDIAKRCNLKPDIVGDINGTAYLTCMNGNTEEGPQAVLKIENGVIPDDFTKTFTTGYSSKDGSWRQMLSATSATDDPVYYMMDGAAEQNGGNRVYKRATDGIYTEISGPISQWQHEGVANRWGSVALGSLKYFEFNGKSYVAFVHCSWTAVFLSVMPEETILNPTNHDGDKTILYYQIESNSGFSSVHPGFAVQYDEARDVLYIVFTDKSAAINDSEGRYVGSTSMICHKLTRLPN